MDSYLGASDERRGESIQAGKWTDPVAPRTSGSMSDAPPVVDPGTSRGTRDRRLAITFWLGFASGLPLALSSGTLTYFLARYGVKPEVVGLFGLVAVPYTYKFLWAPLLDRLDPGPLVRIGRRRGWLLLIQLALAAAILATGLTDPERRPLMTAIGAFAIAILSASQDVVVDALRVESLDLGDEGWGAALTQWGYRLGMFASGFGALHLADRAAFREVYAVMAALALLGCVATWFAIEPESASRPEHEPFTEFLTKAIVAPFRSLASRHPFAWIVGFLVVYRLGDAWAGQMTNPYLVQAGFTGGEIANVIKLYGTIATFAGIAAGGYVVSRVSAVRSLPYAVILMAVSNVGYAWLATAGHSIPALTIAVSIENVTSGLGGSIAIAWMSTLCERGGAAAQYALLSAMTSMSRTHLVAASGYVKAAIDHGIAGSSLAGSGWALYFLATVVAGLPGIGLAFIVTGRSEQRAEQRLEA